MFKFKCQICNKNLKSKKTENCIKFHRNCLLNYFADTKNPVFNIKGYKKGLRILREGLIKKTIIYDEEKKIFLRYQKGINEYKKIYRTELINI